MRALFLVAFLVGASAVLVGGQSFGFSSGIDEEAEATGGGTTTLVAGGCSCHNPQYAGTARAVLEGVPAFYTFGGATGAGPYNLTVRIVGGPEAGGSNQGGFNLQVVGEHPGELQVPAGQDDVQIMNGEATHTGRGNDQREWQVLWVPPTEAGADVQFILTVNAVNGNSVPDPGDVWGRATYLSMGTTRLGAAAEEHGGTEDIVALGVNFYAYWVGVISFIVLFVVLAATFFLLRYGETRHWTDWKDRPSRDKGEDAPQSATGTWVVLGVVLVVFAVAAVQVLRLV